VHVRSSCFAVAVLFFISSAHGVLTPPVRAYVDPNFQQGSSNLAHTRAEILIVAYAPQSSEHLVHTIRS
jgi:hypothetical protein